MIGSNDGPGGHDDRGRRTGPCTDRIAASLDEFLAAHAETAAHAPGVAGEVASVRAALDEPLRIAVTGRVNAGKSTIVNALLRQRVAATDVSECTRYVTTFSYGVPERVEAVLVDGRRRPLALRPDGRLPERLGAAIDGADEIDRLEVFLSNTSLREVTLIDTPGIASTDETVGAAAGELLALDHRSRAAAAGADVLLFVVAGDLERDDTRFLESFQRLFGGLASSSFSTVTVLNKVDHEFDRSTHPVRDAGDRCDRLSRQLRASVAAVVPLVGLLAETAETGALTQREVEHLVAASRADAATVERALMSVDRFVRSDVIAPTAPEREHLLELLDLSGVRMVLEALREGDPGVATTLAVVRGRSGLQSLHRLMSERVLRHADALKAAAALSGLERIAYRATGAARNALLDRLDQLLIDPTVHRVRELTVLQRVAAGELVIGPSLRLELDRLIGEGSLHERLGVPASAGIEGVRSAISSGVQRWRTFASQQTASTARESALIVARSYELLWPDTAHT